MKEIRKKDWMLFGWYIPIALIFLCSAVGGFVVSCIFYNVLEHKNEKNLKTYSESDYEYLDEIADNVIKKDGIDVSAIPEDVVRYEITKKDNKIIVMYSLGENIKTYPSMTITLSKDLELLNKESNSCSIKKFQKIEKRNVILIAVAIGLFASLIIFMTVIYVLISCLPKHDNEKNPKNNLSKKY